MDRPSEIWMAARAVVTPVIIKAKAAIAAQAKSMREVMFSASLSMSGPTSTPDAASVNGTLHFRSSARTRPSSG